MKKTIFFLAIGILFCLIGRAQQVEVGSDKSFEAPMGEYKTYAWSKQIDKIPGDAVFVGPNGVMIFNNESSRKRIKDAIEYQLDAKGYKQDNSNPDMIVLYDVLEQPTTLTTYNGYKMYNYGMDSTRTPENVEQTDVTEGTLLINVVDAKTSKVAWQAYASGILKPDMMNDEGKIRHAVASMFDEFEYRAQQ